ncbi:MAG: O-antigen ligase family protein [Thermodesulfobacteriota bacterium]
MILPDEPRRAAWASRARDLLRLSLAVHVLGLALGNAVFEAGAVGTFASLAAYYILDWRGSNLRRFTPRWPYFLFLATVGLGMAHSVSPGSGLYVLKHTWYKGPLLVLAGLEAVRGWRDLGLFAWTFAAVACLRGLAGTWELGAHGWIAEKRVGNLMALALPLCFCLPLFLPRSWPAWQRWLATALVALPGLITWAGAEARSGWLGLCAAALAFFWMRMSARKAALAAALVVAAVILARPGHLTLQDVTSDARWEIWGVALKVWLAHPLLGAGVNAFEPGYRALGIVFDPTRYDNSMPHPHNIYLQFLAEGGLVGLAVFLNFALGYALRAGRRIKAALARAANHRGRPARDFTHWFAAACCWSGFVGYLASGLSAHSFFRGWWLSAAMTLLGLTLGALAAAPDDSGDTA